jgi:hypothetical protein
VNEEDKYCLKEISDAHFKIYGSVRLRRESY